MVFPWYFHRKIFQVPVKFNDIHRIGSRENLQVFTYVYHQNPSNIRGFPLKTHCEDESHETSFSHRFRSLETSIFFSALIGDNSQLSPTLDPRFSITDHDPTAEKTGLGTPMQWPMDCSWIALGRSSPRRTRGGWVAGPPFLDRFQWFWMMVERWW